MHDILFHDQALTAHCLPYDEFVKMFWESLVKPKNGHLKHIGEYKFFNVQLQNLKDLLKHTDTPDDDYLIICRDNASKIVLSGTQTVHSARPDSISHEIFYVLLRVDGKIERHCHRTYSDGEGNKHERSSTAILKILEYCKGIGGMFKNVFIVSDGETAYIL